MLHFEWDFRKGFVCAPYVVRYDSTYDIIKSFFSMHRFIVSGTNHKGTLNLCGIKLMDIKHASNPCGFVTDMQ